MGANLNRKKAAKEFADWWKGKGYEKGETQTFWNSLLQKVFGIENYEKVISFETRVKLNKTSFMDAYIVPTHVLIEQKSIKIDLSKPVPQSDGSTLTPYEQAERYNNNLKYSEKARWIVICNFREFHIYDMEKPKSAPEIIKLEDLPNEYHRLQFLVNDTVTNIKKEEQISLKAGEIVGVLYDKLLQAYIDPNNPESQKSLNKLCVRLVFCFYAEDADIFGNKNMFHDYMVQYEGDNFRTRLIELFRVLDTRPEERDPYMDEALAAFPYVNGGLFSGDIEIPRINEETRMLILRRASDGFDWSGISPTIFGAVFESTLNPETRRGGGMHYTSVENIHKVIDPLFLDELKAELAVVKAAKRGKRDKAIAFQDKLAGLKFLDPACGSGNFLTESYTSLRRLENEAIRIIYGTDRLMGGITNPIKMSINQFYGIEINDFACSVAQTALWIAELQMLQETDEIVGFNLDPLPLKSYTNICEGNALRMDWNEVVSAAELNYIMGNPPFHGFTFMEDSQRAEMQTLFPGVKNLDYVCGWYKKASDIMTGTRIQTCFVSTNSIVQGETVARFWDFLPNDIINFAHKTFVWESEANQKAHVHCVIIGFAKYHRQKKLLYDGKNQIECKNINRYLMDGDDILVKSRNKPLCKVPAMIYGNKPADGGHLIIEDSDYADFVHKDPESIAYIKPLMGATEYINNKKRWCLWLESVSPSEIKKCPMIYERVRLCKESREQSIADGIRKFALTPSLFAQRTQPVDKDFIIIPRVSSQTRQYIPMGFIKSGTIVTDRVQIIPDADTFAFGVIISSVHMAWMRVTCMRLKSDYSYSKDVVYNNFPWPTVTPKQKEKIEQTAQAILDARALYPDSSLADLYDELTMPVELRRAHRANDAAVMEAYGFAKTLSESEIVTRLFQLYQKLTCKD